MWLAFLPSTACTKTSAQRKWSKTKRKKTGKSVSCDVKSVEKLIEEEAEVACARPHQWHQALCHQ